MYQPIKASHDINIDAMMAERERYIQELGKMHARYIKELEEMHELYLQSIRAEREKRHLMEKELTRQMNAQHERIEALEYDLLLAQLNAKPIKLRIIRRIENQTP